MPETKATVDAANAFSPSGYAAIVAAWIVPGLGHFLLKRRGCAAIIFLCVGGLVIAGYAMRGQVYSMRAGDLLGFMTHLAEIGTGVFYFLARFFEPHGANTARAVGDVGTRLLAIAGLLNFLCVLDAWGIARRKAESEGRGGLLSGGDCGAQGTSVRS